MRSLLIAVFLASSTALFAAEQVCPWINTATASGILGGDASAAIAHGKTNPDDGVCTFTKSGKELTELLRVDVTTSTDPVPELARYRSQCSGPATDVKGIGNEAFVCKMQAQGLLVAQLATRVRNRVITVRATTNNQSAQPEMLIDRAQKAAAQVTGNIF
ncbi:MAG: hypothetical protein JO033_03790 [Acidobacteriaceae bacterium]|nr:hypothetical protein [Acidobacteriaceae bacterium]MBV9498935.1 hypothetical protein [Acidobacteriaceae bacterium]